MSNDFMTAVRLPSEVVEQLDAIAEQMSRENPGVKVTRAAVIRMMVMKGLSNDLEKQERLIRRRSTVKKKVGR